MTPPPTLQQLIESVLADAGPDAGCLGRLAEAVRTATDMGEAADALLGHFVDKARHDGRSWTEISEVMGVTKQAAHKRFSPAANLNSGLERWTPRARAVIDHASREAADLGHNYIGTEHFLLAFYRDPAAIAPVVLSEAGVSRDGMRAALASRVATGPAAAVSGPRPMTPRAQQALAAAAAEAVGLGHNYVGTEHVLLAILANPSSLGAQMLSDLGVQREAVVGAVRRRIEAVASGGTAGR